MDVMSDFTRRPLMKSYMVYEYMKEELKKGNWKFGEKIPIENISSQFNISRRPVLDAMKMLENDRFVEIIPQSGCKVVDYSRKEIYDHFLMCSVLEGLCAELASLYHTPEEIARLEKFHLTAKERPVDYDDKSEYFKYNREFHSQLLAMTRSKKLISYAIPLWDLNDFYLVNIFEHFNIFVSDSFEFHDQIVEAVKLRDRYKAKQIMEEHIRSFVKQLMEALPSSQTDLRYQT